MIKFDNYVCVTNGVNSACLLKCCKFNFGTGLSRSRRVFDVGSTSNGKLVSFETHICQSRRCGSPWRYSDIVSDFVTVFYRAFSSTSSSFACTLKCCTNWHVYSHCNVRLCLQASEICFFLFFWKFYRISLVISYSVLLKDNIASSV